MQQLAAELLPVARLVVVGAFVALAVLAVVRRRRTGRAGRWVALTFIVLALVVLTGEGMAPALWEMPAWAEQLRLVTLLTTPYLLLRFTASFQPLPRRLEVAVAAATATVMIATLLTPSLPESPASRPAWVGPYLLGVVVYWTGLSLVTVVRLWRAGHGQPVATRRRMRLMSAATAVLTVALLLAAGLGAGADAELLIQLVALVSVVAFALGLHPPQAVRLSWRRDDERRLQHGTMAVLRATTTRDVADALLAPTSRVVGGSGAILVDPDGMVVASHGDAPAPGSAWPAQQRPSHGGRQPVEVVPLGDDIGELVAFTSPYTPFFGRDEVELLHTMGAVASLALERVRLLEEDARQRAVLEQARREAERSRDEAARANTAKSEFLSRMSHELRTPLNAILGFGQLLETDDVDEADRREWVGHILKAGRHLLALINDVLDLSRIEAGTMTISPETVHAGELIGDALGLIRPSADTRSIRLLSDLEHCDVYITTDRQRCRQVLLNLLSNAVKYNHDEGSVHLHCAPGAEGFLRISVTDTGPGIDPARHEQLFRPFERLGADASGVEGTGLGLALSKQLAERMDGMLGFDTNPGRGSTFWIEMPTAEIPIAPDAEAESPEPLKPPAGGHTLLLIEDNLANLRVVEAALKRRRGITVVPAMLGGLGIDLAREHHPDVIILDLHLPDLPGREVLHRLKADARTRHIPVIIASADASPGRVQQLRAEGAFDYVTKPLDLSQFIDAVNAALHQGTEEPATGDPSTPPTD